MTIDKVKRELVDTRMVSKIDDTSPFIYKFQNGTYMSAQIALDQNIN